VDSGQLRKVWFDIMRLLAFMEDDEDGLTSEERLYRARDLLQMIEKNYYRGLSSTGALETQH
jgi:hypothetical protein